MSTSKNDGVEDVCASCRTTGGSSIKLKKCKACKLVRYCSIACQKKHRPEHKHECKRRAAELREELLFKQPEISHMGDCPLCFLPLPLHMKKITHHACCSKDICNGCDYAYLANKCPFCRTPAPKTKAENKKLLMKRIEANDPVAICYMGTSHYNEQNYSSAFDFWERAAKLGNMEAHHQLAGLYTFGKGAVRTDHEKMTQHLEEAAIGGHPVARYNLGVREDRRGRSERAIRHFIIAANLGFDGAIEMIKECFTMGIVKKDDLAAALRAHKAALDATKSPQREAAERYFAKTDW